MDEYVKIKLDTYNKFKEIERNGRLSASVELFGGIISYERLLTMKITLRAKLL
ncbi:hypothetical protein PSC55_000672 [Listeria monocytogenes]|nr:hypothetical protein [Listeria monocytogenes]EHY0437258.1 hypothetical protein [Listeria monocytogenes]EJO3820797.1 hypothetical protein [Listeria monocytogenes]EKL6026109.1 hypothetical protein [Listeria monocytogenes]